jgi:hypothetical protein
MSARKPNFGIEYTKNVTVVKKQNAQDNDTVSLNGTLHALQYRVRGGNIITPSLQ